MFRDTEQTYGGYTLDVYEDETNGVCQGWICDFWTAGDADSGKLTAPKRKAVIEMTKAEIDRRRKPTEKTG